jgi:hypothetical protein
MGYIRPDASGKETVVATDSNSSRSDSAYKATSQIPGNSSAVIHGHIAESGLKDDVRSIGDVQPLVDLSIPNIAVSPDGRIIAHELEDGRYQVRMLQGHMTPDEVDFYTERVNIRQAEEFSDD